MIPDEKYIPGNRENLRQPIQIKFSDKLQIFSELFTAYFKSPLNCKHLEKKMYLIAYVFPKLESAIYMFM